MTTLKIHNIESAPAEAKPLLENSQKAYGMIPGLHGVLAGSPQILKAYQTLHELFTQSSFNEDELTSIVQYSGIYTKNIHIVKSNSEKAEKCSQQKYISHILDSFYEMMLLIHVPSLVFIPQLLKDFVIY